MSCQRGNINRTRPQKHKNRTVFKNDLHDTNIRTKRVNQTQICNVCDKCKAILEWKIKYKKYKPLKTPRSCNKCHQKTVKQPYHTICSICARSLHVCPKCEASIMYMTEEPDLNEEHQLDNNYDDSDFNSNTSGEECCPKVSKMT